MPAGEPSWVVAVVAVEVPPLSGSVALEAALSWATFVLASGPPPKVTV